MYQPDHGALGIRLGGKHLFESYGYDRHGLCLKLHADGKLVLLHYPQSQSRRTKVSPKALKRIQTPALSEGETLIFDLRTKIQQGKASFEAILTRGSNTFKLGPLPLPQSTNTEGYLGLTAQGLLDFSLDEIHLQSPQSELLPVQENACITCYALGDSLKQRQDGKWQVTFLALFTRAGKGAEIKISTEELAEEAWTNVPNAASAPIADNEFRHHTAVLHAVLPEDPSKHTHYYTIWKDGVNCTADVRIGTRATGPGTGYVGDVPRQGSYLGRLPQLTAPYKLCGLSCHAITGFKSLGESWGLQRTQRTNSPKAEAAFARDGGIDEYLFRDQPTEDAFLHLEDYNFQIMAWEDDVWYLELAIYPPSTEDAYKTITASICGPTSRWQMMRHWNVINPGDHDYGMDDIKGPEQLVLRQHENLGQDRDYLRRNFQIVHHLVTGAEEVDPVANPKKWRRWHMPNGDFSLLVLDARLWRSSQDTDLWSEEGWGHVKNLYDRRDPTRSLLGEEQFAWLSDIVRTDPSPLMCLTGLNALHTVWAGYKASENHPQKFGQLDRVTADYAGWVTAGANRILELLGSRQGIATVFGDIHVGSILTNPEQRLAECSFGPIGRYGGRDLIPGFGPEMKDADGRKVNVHALYHQDYQNPQLEGHHKGEPLYYNFLEMAFDPTVEDPEMHFTIRNLIDAPKDKPRGGTDLRMTASKTGRAETTALPEIKTLPEAQVTFLSLSGQPIRAIKSRADGTLPLDALILLEATKEVLMIARKGKETESRVIEL